MTAEEAMHVIEQVSKNKGPKVLLKRSQVFGITLVSCSITTLMGFGLLRAVEYRKGQVNPDREGEKLQPVNGSDLLLQNMINDARGNTWQGNMERADKAMGIFMRSQPPS